MNQVMFIFENGFTPLNNVLRGEVGKAIKVAIVSIESYGIATDDTFRHMYNTNDK